MSSEIVPETIGTATFIVDSKSYQTWYKVIGDLKSGQTPLVTLHGGPGAGHQYQLRFCLSRIPIICYDQLGNGKSTHIPDAPKEFWTPELFMDELENLVLHLGISNNYDLVGHSWGGMLGGNIAAARQPKGLRRLIINSSPASMDLLIRGINTLLEKFPPDFVAMLHKHEAEGTTDSKEYQDGMWVFLKKHVCTLDPWPEPVMTSFQALETDPTVYHTMLGPSEFCIIGSLKDWNIIDIMHKIRCETLLISAPEDEVQEVALLPWFLNVPKIKWVELANSTHLALYEEEARYVPKFGKMESNNSNLGAQQIYQGHYKLLDRLMKR
ncbi:hypothetical protein GALMADRAFT_77364 [Galerina marginata CBS 339.88]|uniref:AB hydrolase-1 domain-containing protein n=1 Tax=Galerina marginata (strain CBS 339.88) TaxID=685588 RepID=A0A067SPQ4_GALM3|nr:hypothetical protein GALMADRAFT_77364 [Galerina marginata CBS 339.88]